MDPLIATLLANGPSMLRLAGKLFGGRTEEVSTGVADVIDLVQSKPVSQQKSILQNHLKQLTGEDLDKLGQVKIRLEEIAAEREKNQLLHEQSLHSETQQTARAEQQFGTDYVKETRPLIARRSFCVGSAYVLVAEATRLISEAWGGSIQGCSWELAGALFAPCLGYIGARTWDKMKDFNR